MNAYRRVLKDEKADVYKKVATPDGMGGISYEYRPISSSGLWCFTRVTDSNIDLIGDSKNYIEQREFTFNYNENIKVFDYIKFKDTWFEIIEIRNEYAGETFVIAKRISGSFPDQSEILSD